MLDVVGEQLLLHPIEPTALYIDADENESCHRLAFMIALGVEDLGFIRQEINILMSDAPASEDDAIIVIYPDFTK
ncbi:hypothetical protein PsorP6_002695 [Peronosclerospora sorghi]|uniref:Uncharacterized protein n=1 Tax=Peronosclerospora sorghi TaxID=230839 RepID=A0ACC0WTB6_9STRA|nr:hypothetical protein PsorP6_002695 [Peronosclerospora sorghi]